MRSIFKKKLEAIKKPQEFGKPCVWDGRKSNHLRAWWIMCLWLNYLTFVEFIITFPCNSIAHFIRSISTTSIYLSTLSFVSRHSISFYTSAFWISYQVKEVISPSVLLTIQLFRRWTLWMPWKVNRGSVYQFTSLPCRVGVLV